MSVIFQKLMFFFKGIELILSKESLFHILKVYSLQGTRPCGCCTVFTLFVCIWVCISIVKMHLYVSMVALCTLKDLCVYDLIPCISFMAHGLMGVVRSLFMHFICLFASLPFHGS